jgi:hypothetical protein
MLQCKNVLLAGFAMTILGFSGVAEALPCRVCSQWDFHIIKYRHGPAVREYQKREWFCVRWTDPCILPPKPPPRHFPSHR